MTVHSKVDGGRSADHRRVLISALLVTPAGERRIMIRDISPKGAHVTSRERIPHSCDAILKRGPLFAAARVVSESDGEVALQFYRELSDEEIERALFRAGD